MSLTASSEGVLVVPKENGSTFLILLFIELMFRQSSMHKLIFYFMNKLPLLLRWDRSERLHDKQDQSDLIHFISSLGIH